MNKHKWTDEERKYLKNNFNLNKDRKELLSKFNLRFNTNITINSLSAELSRQKLLNPNSDFTSEMEQWLKDNYNSLNTNSIQDLTNNFNKVFGTNKTQKSVWHKAYRLSKHDFIKNNTRIYYTLEMIDRLKELVPKYSYAKCAEILSKEFNYNFTAEMINHKASRLGIKKPNRGFSNLDPSLPNNGKFKKGMIGFKTKPVGTEIMRTTKDGRMFIVVKIGEPDVWEFKHRLIWQQYHGEIPKNGRIIFADNNTMNFDIDNLLLVSINENKYLSYYNLKFDDKDLTKTGLNILRLNNCKSRKQRERKIKIK